MNLRVLVPPGLYGGGAAAVVAALGYALAASQSFPLALTAFAFTFGGLTAFSILTGAISRHGNAEDPEIIVTQNNPTTPPEPSTPYRLLLACFSVALTLAGVLGLVLFR